VPLPPLDSEAPLQPPERNVPPQVDIILEGYHTQPQEPNEPPDFDGQEPGQVLDEREERGNDVVQLPEFDLPAAEDEAARLKSSSDAAHLEAVRLQSSSDEAHRETARIQSMLDVALREAARRTSLSDAANLEDARRRKLYDAAHHVARQMRAALQKKAVALEEEKAEQDALQERARLRSLRMLAAKQEVLDAQEKFRRTQAQG
jgi:hypothetical protein